MECLWGGRGEGFVGFGYINIYFFRTYHNMIVSWYNLVETNPEKTKYIISQHAYSVCGWITVIFKSTMLWLMLKIHRVKTNQKTQIAKIALYILYINQIVVPDRICMLRNDILSKFWVCQLKWGQVSIIVKWVRIIYNVYNQT